jgi:uncharacterized protein GlcG (DUF336 family)
MKNGKIGLAVGAALALAASQSAFATCADINAVLQTGIDAATAANVDGGYPLKFWITAVDESGLVCAVKTNGVTGATAGNNEWLGSRVISAQKANTANAFSLDGYAISTANLYSAVQPGGSLYGLQHSNPIDASRAYGGSSATFGTNADYLKNKRIGGVNVFGGGLALYKNGKKVGAIGVSGDTSCADHAFAWQVRKGMGMRPSDGQASGLASLSASGYVGITTVNFDSNGNLYGVGGTAVLAGATEGDEMIIQGTVNPDAYWTGWSHPACPNTSYTAEGVVENGTH